MAQADRITALERELSRRQSEIDALRKRHEGLAGLVAMLEGTWSGGARSPRCGTPAADARAAARPRQAALGRTPNFFRMFTSGQKLVKLLCSRFARRTR